MKRFSRYRSSKAKRTISAAHGNANVSRARERDRARLGMGNNFAQRCVLFGDLEFAQHL